MIKTLYGDFSNEQMRDYKKHLHNRIHWLLIYKEEDYDKLDDYFSSILFQLFGLNELLGYPEALVSLASILQAAKLESLSADCDFKKYRKAILDAHSLIDKLPEWDGDSNG